MSARMSAYLVAYVLVNKVCLICQRLLTLFLISWPPMTLLHSDIRDWTSYPLYDTSYTLMSYLWAMIKYFPRESDDIQKQYLHMLTFSPKILPNLTNISNTRLMVISPDWDHVTVA